MSDYLPSFVSLVGGSLSGAAVSILIQGPREQRKTTMRVIEQFSTLEAHKMRQKFFYGIEPLASLDEIGQIEDEDVRFAILYVMSYFINAMNLIHYSALDKKLFFAMSARWLNEILFNNLVKRADRTREDGPYGIHRQAIKDLFDQWNAANPSPRHRIPRN